MAELLPLISTPVQLPANRYRVMARARRPGCSLHLLFTLLTVLALWLHVRVAYLHRCSVFMTGVSTKYTFSCHFGVYSRKQDSHNVLQVARLCTLLYCLGQWCFGMPMGTQLSLIAFVEVDKEVLAARSLSMEIGCHAGGGKNWRRYVVLGAERCNTLEMYFSSSLGFSLGEPSDSEQQAESLHDRA